MRVPLMVMLLGLLFVSAPAFAMTVSGKVANNSGDTGRVYVGLKQTWGGNFVYSVSLPNPGTTATSFVIKGVENGSYNLFAFVDRTNTGVMHANDPVVQRPVTVSNANYSTGNLTISAKSLVLPPAALDSPGILPASGSAGVVIDNVTDANGAVIADSYNVSCNGGTIVRNNVPTVSLTGDSAVLVITGLSNGSTFSCNATPVIRGSARSTYTSADGSGTIGDTCNTFGTCSSGVTVSGKVNFTGFSSLSGKTLLVALTTWNGMPYVTTISNPSAQQAWSIPGVQASASAYRTSLYLIDNATGVWQGQINERTEQARLTVEGGDNVIAPTQNFPLRNTAMSVSVVSQYGPYNTDPVFSLMFDTFWNQKRPVNITLSNVTGTALPAEGVSCAGMDGLRVFTGSNRPTSDDSYQASLEYSDGSSEIQPLKVIKGGSQETLTQSFPVGNVRMPDLSNPVYAWHYGIPTGMIPFTSSVYSGNQFLENLTSASNWLTLPGSSLNLNSQTWLTTELQDVMGDAIEFSGDFTPVGSGPVISNFTPTSGPGGATVTINGSGFTSATRVTFNGIADKSFSVVSGNQIIAHVPGGASRGPITVTDNNQVTGASSAPFEKTVTVAGTLTNISNAGVNGVTVRAIGGGVPITATSATSGGVAGNYSFNVPAGVPLQYKMHDTSGTYLDSYSKLITATNNYDGSYAMIRTSDLTGWAAVDASFTAVANGSAGLIRGRVATPADVNLSGATVQVMSKNHPGGSPSYKVIYGNGSNAPDTTKTATSSDGRFFVTGIEQGDIVYAQVTLAGYAFQDTFYQVYNGSVSGGKVNGDLMPNQLTLTPNGGQVALQQTVTVSWDPALTGTLFYTTDGSNPRSNGTGIPVANATSASFTLTAEGSQMVRCILKNNAGVFGDEVQTSFYVMQDTIPPQVIIMPPGTAFGSGYGYSNTLPIPVTFISDEPATIWFTTDGSDPFTSASRLSVVVPTVGGSVSVPPVADGTTVKFYGIDLANNQSQERIVTMIFDNTAPVIGTVSPNSFSGTNAFNATNASFFITATDNSSPNVLLWYLVTDTTAPPAVNATGWSTSPIVTVTVPGEGSYNRYAWVKDEAGNLSQYRLLSFTVDMTPPARPIITPFANNRSNSQQLYLAGTAEANATVTVYDGGTALPAVAANGQGAWGMNWFFGEGTTHTLTATATDVAGNTGLASQPVTVTVDSLPPTTSASSNPPLPGTGFYTPGTAVTVTLTASETATVYYTTNGVDPNPAACTGACKSGASPLQIPITNSTTFKFLSVDTAGNVESSVNTVSYSYGQPTITTVQQANAPVTYTPGNSTLTLTAIVTSASAPTGTVTFLVDGIAVGSPVALDGSGIATQNYTGVVAAGTHIIVANFSGNAQFSASLATTSFNVAKATATLSAGSISRTYTGALQSVPYTTTPPGLAASFSFSQGGIAALPLNAGSYDFSGSIEDPNYQGSATGTLVIQKASLSITAGSTVVANRAYNGTTAATITSPGTLSGILAQDNVTLTGGIAAFGDATVGNAKVVSVTGLTLSGTGAGNYTLSGSTATATANITQALLTVTADPASMVYGSVDPLFTYRVTGTLYGSDALTGALGRSAGLSVAGSPYAINQGTLSAGANYSINFVPASLTVTAKPLTINGITANSKVYDGTRSATLNTGAVSLTGVVASDAVSLSGTATGTFDTKNAGTGKTVSFSGLSLTGAAAGNYSITTTASTTANITPAQLSVNAGTTVVGNKGYDGTTAATITSAGTLSGILSPDVVTLGGGSANFADPNAGNGKTVNIVGLTLGGTDAGNYALASATATTTANIAKAPLTVTADPASKVYGAADPVLGYRSTGTLYGSDALTGALGRAGGESVAGSPYAINLGTLSAGANYSINFVPANLAVTAKQLVINGITANNKVYDGTRSATLNNGAVSLTGVVGSDAVSLSGTATGTFDTKNVGTGKTVSFSGLSLTGAAAGNYSIGTTANTTASITPAQLSVNAGTTVVGNKGYDGTTAAIITSAGTLSGILSPDVVTLGGGSANFADPNAGNGKTVNIVGLTLGGTDAGNYALTNATATATANITKAPLTVTADPASKVYGAADPVLGYRSTGTLYGSDALTGTLGRTGGEGVAGSPYAINLGTLSAGANYSISFVPANFAVTAKPLVINGITANNKVYDGTRSATLNNGAVSLSGVVGGDAVSLSGTATGSFDTKNAGTGKTVSFSGLSLTGAAAGNYSIGTTASTTADITPAPLTVNPGTSVVANKVYDGSTATTITSAGTLSGVIAPDLVTVGGGSANFADPNAGNGKTVTIAGLTLGGADAANYTLAGGATATANIAKAGQTISFSTALVDKVVGDPQFDFTATANSGLPVTISVTGPATYLAPTLALQTPALVPTSAADYTVTVTATQPGDANHNPATLSGTFKVLQLGDITHDGSVTIADAMEYLKVALHLDSPPGFTRNIILDGSNRSVIDVRDVLLVLQKVVAQPI
ncbi:hypothetical protein GMST_21150 [Geomonas silvestris]|uniref:IPT/TIG domain-containing protein n=1 Tax=Geomonas silvestris TaxID=2740184 RepID=A0A6V8MIE6_9BACT|nr:hypothetical protein GMST_21150 [Geomonas silvestris]